MKKTVITIVAALACVLSSAQTKLPKYIPVYLDNGKFIYIDAKTGEKCPRSEEYEYCTWFRDGVALVFDEGFASCHFIDDRFHRVFPNNFIDATIFSEGLAFICEDGTVFKAIDKEGSVRFALRKAENVYPIQGGFAVFKGQNGKIGLVTSRGSIAVPPTYAMIEDVVNNCMKVTTEDGLQGLIGPDGAVILDPVYEQVVWNKATAFSGLVPVLKDEKYGLYSIEKSEFISPFVYDFIHPDKNMIAYITEDACGWMDMDGNSQISAYGGIDLFGNAELAPARSEEGFWGYVNVMGEMTVGATYDYAESFDECGTAVISKNGRYGLISSKGSLIVPPAYSELTYVGYGIYCFHDKNMTGAINYMGKVVVKPSEKYLDIPILEDDLDCAGLRN